jgi:hypothetical protein
LTDVIAVVTWVDVRMGGRFFSSVPHPCLLTIHCLDILLWGHANGWAGVWALAWEREMVGLPNIK